MLWIMSSSTREGQFRVREVRAFISETVKSSREKQPLKSREERLILDEISASKREEQSAKLRETRLSKFRILRDCRAVLFFRSRELMPVKESDRDCKAVLWLRSSSEIFAPWHSKDCKGQRPGRNRKRHGIGRRKAGGFCGNHVCNRKRGR